MSAPLPTTFTKSVQADVATLPEAQRNTIRAMARSHSRLTLGKRLADGTLEVVGLPFWQQGRYLATGAEGSREWHPWPKVKGGAYHHAVPYRVHTDGKRCGFGWKGCPTCIAAGFGTKPEGDRSKTLARLVAAGGDALMPTSFPKPAKETEAKPTKRASRRKRASQPVSEASSTDAAPTQGEEANAA